MTNKQKIQEFLSGEGFDRFIRYVIHEDSHGGDITSEALVDENATGNAKIFVKEWGVLSGVDVAKKVFQWIDEQLDIKILMEDGTALKEGDEVLHISGNVRSILKGERIVLNFLQHLSGIATRTAEFVKIAGIIKVLDTRKTIPGLRILQKYAVECGGGVNHRMGLDDEFMIKDNHLSWMNRKGGIAEAVKRVRNYRPGVKVTVEADCLNHVEEAIKAGADRVLLDNMDVEGIKKAVEIGKGKVVLEVSGGVTFEKLLGLQGVEVDCVSVGELTHSVKALDFSLEMIGT